EDPRPSERADQAAISHILERGKAVQRELSRRRSEGDPSLRELYQVSGFPAISYSAGGRFQGTPRGPEACTNRGAIKQGDIALDPKCAQSVLPMVSRPARLQIAPQICRRRIF